ncbi:MAG: FxsA family protein [Hyphomicrobiales bacterium]
MAWLFIVIFVVAPLLEIYAFIQVGSAIGALPTLALIVLTAIVGAILVRWQGLKVVMDARQSMARDELPVAAAVHGGLLLLAGLLLVTPGFVTDAAGFLLLVPPVRSLVAARVWTWLEAKANTRAKSARGTRRRPAVIEAEAVEIDSDEEPRRPGRNTSPWTSNDGTAR